MIRKFKSSLGKNSKHNFCIDKIFITAE
ncbi:hypothetical protein [Candidatus Galacturonibacter soehngenii]